MVDLRKDIDVAERKTEIALVLGAAVLVLAGVSQAATSGSILDAGSSSGELAAEYRFDTGAGETAYDSMNGNDATLDNFDFDSSSGWSEGVKGKAVEFDGSNDQVLAPSDFEFYDSDSDPWTISVWFKIQTKASTAGHDMTIFDNNNRYHMQLNDANDELQSIPGGNSFGWGWSPSKGRWHHAVLVYDGNGNIDAYANGELVREKSGVTPYESGKAGGRVIFGSHGGSRFFDGKIDNVKVLTDNISKSQVRSLYNSGYLSVGKKESHDPSKMVDISFTQQNSSHVQDVSGYNNHGRKQAGVTQVSAGGCRVGRCIKLDGSSSTGVDMNDIWSDHTQSRTFMFWFKEAERGASSGDRIISQDCSEWFCLYDHGTDDWRVCYDGCSSFHLSMDQDKWHHAAMVFDESNANLTLYLDGRKRTEVSYSSSWSHGTRPIVLGGNTEGTDDISGGHWEGKIDNFKVFDRSLSQAEIIEKTQGLKGGGTVLDLRFNRNGGDKVQDYSGENNHGTLQPNSSAGPKWVDGLTGNALKFDGSDDYVSVSDSSELDIGSGGLTVSAWVKFREDSNGNNWMLFDKGTSQSGTYYLYSDGSSVRMTVKDGSNRYDASVDPSKIPQNDWVHLVGRYDESQVELWMNGEKLASTSAPSNLGSNGQPVWLGEYQGEGYQLEGKIDEAKIYPYAVSNSKIQQLYSRGKTTPIGSSSSSSSRNLRKGLVLSQTFDRIETCGQSDTVSCPSGMNGKVAVDESGNANHGELLNGPKEKAGGQCKKGGMSGV